MQFDFRIILSLLILLTHSWSVGQMTENDVRRFVETASEGELLEKNNIFLIEGDIYFADIVAEKLVSLQPNNPNYNYRKGYSVLELSKNYKVAIPHFEKAISSISNNYDLFSTREKSAPSDAYFYLGKCYHLAEDIDAAEKYYTLFITKSRSKSELLPLAKLFIQQCSVARNLMTNPVNVEVKNLGNIINTSAPEYSPVVSLDGSALYYTSRRPWSINGVDNSRDSKYNQYGEDIYVSYMDFDLAWTEPTRLKFNQPDRNEATVAVSVDERRIHLYLDSQNGGDIFYSEVYGKYFEDVLPIDISGVNTEFWETHCTMSQNLERFFFVSNRTGGYGGRDIYYCELQEDGSWSSPKNMGPKINTAHDEDSPFISFDNQKLYYASNGPKSMGGFDIMMSTLQEDGSWSEGENMGYPFNSTFDDLYYTSTVEGLLGYLTSERDGGFGEKDIYQIENEYLGINNISALKGTINNFSVNGHTDKPSVSISIECSDCEMNKKPMIYPRQRDGFYLSHLEACKKYIIKYIHLESKTILYTDSFTTSCRPEFAEVTREFTLNNDGTLTLVEPLITQKRDSLILPDVKTTPFIDFGFTQFFGYNENALSITEGKLKAFIDQLEAQMKEGRGESKILIYASASKVPTQKYKSNEKLAERRASNAQSLLTNYISNNPLLKDKVTVQIVETKVQGPAYNGDRTNIDAYTPFQYVRIDIK